MTTNESVKWSSVKTWYKKELKLYNDAVKAGIVVEQDASDLNNKPVVPDGDVTCVPGSQNTKNDHDVGEKEEEETTTEKITHPGPMPKNIYDRGVVENWKEVLFPRSLRSDAMERYRKSLLREYARRQQEAVTEGREIDSTASASTPSAVLDPGKQKSN
eukprot:CAMPEP_0202477020 /NCGR_PEP_ID=MMETSP1360-20130828/93728_1 /ASSEMBLY_ACC=CAM_ASM_000848 /TAXON_ID=515479 /ORGANISM="Licmophora paradoxa, Strain CCMP2313" /LENGTH=158 /DNA_ID=CAMNT_0049104251 /DNA_START=48 /DNA_END=524 /DNA_ORIENTATION=+